MARRIEILMVDDDDVADVAFTQDVLADHRVANTMTVLDDGAAAWRYLTRRPPYADAVRPDCCCST